MFLYVYAQLFYDLYDVSHSYDDSSRGIPDNEENTVLIHAARVGNVALISKLIALFKRFRLYVDCAIKPSRYD